MPDHKHYEHTKYGKCGCEYESESESSTGQNTNNPINPNNPNNAGNTGSFGEIITRSSECTDSVSSDDSCNRKCRINTSCDETACNMVRHTVSEEQDIQTMITDLLINFNQSIVGPVLIDVDINHNMEPIGPSGSTAATILAALVDGHMYYIVNSDQYVQGNPLPSGAVPFTYHSPLDVTIIGDPRQTQNLGQLFALLGYIVDRISNLCVPCCVKEKINNAIIAYADSVLNPTDGSTGYNPIGLESFQPFTSFCDPTDEIPKCGPIYIANIVYVDNNGNPVNPPTSQSTTIMSQLQVIKFYIRSYFSTKCCCRSNHPCICNCNMTYNDACKFVFGRLCVVDIKVIEDT